MKNKSALKVLLLFFVLATGFSQEKNTEEIDQLKQLAIQHAQATSDATVAMDFKGVLKHTLPSIVELMGGETNAIQLLKSQFDKMVADGFVYEKAEVKGIKEFIFENDEYRCIIENFNQMKMQNMRITSKSFILGIFDEENNIWHFVEAKQLKNPAMRDMVIPDFKTGMDLPEDEMNTEMIKD